MTIAEDLREFIAVLDFLFDNGHVEYGDLANRISNDLLSVWSAYNCLVRDCKAYVNNEMDFDEFTAEVFSIGEWE